MNDTSQYFVAVDRLMCRTKILKSQYDAKHCTDHRANLKPFERLINELLASENILAITNGVYHPTSQVSINLHL
jgi:hypothetical protein